MIDLKDFKSVEVLTSRSDIENTLADRQAGFQLDASSSPAAVLHTDVEETDDGMVVRKRTPAGTVLSVTMGEPELKTLCEKAHVKWDPAYATRVKTWWASDERVDRHGDIVEQSWTFDEFDRNPLMLNQHEWEQPPIGAVIEHKVEKRSEDAYDGDALVVTGVFATKDQYDVADSVFRLVDAGFMKSGSVGFFPGEVLLVTDEKERQRLGLGRFGVVLRQNSLVEWSPCSVPANVGAHLRSLKRADLTQKVQPGDVVLLRELAREQSRRAGMDTRRWRSVDDDLVSFWKALFPDAKIESAQNIDKPLMQNGQSSGKSNQFTPTLEQRVADLEKACEYFAKTLASGKGAPQNTPAGRKGGGGGEAQPDQLTALAEILKHGNN